MSESNERKLTAKDIWAEIKRHPGVYLLIFLLSGLPIYVATLWGPLVGSKTIPEWLAENGWPRLRTLFAAWVIAALILAVVILVRSWLNAKERALRPDPATRDYLVGRLRDFIKEDGEIRQMRELGRMSRAFTFQGDVQHLLSLYSDEYVRRFTADGVYALEGIIKELLDGAPIPVSDDSEAARPAPPLRLPAFKIFNLFEKVYNEHKDELGQPKGEAEPIKHAYVAQYDKAKVIWDENAGNLYQLHMRKNVWISAPDFLDDDLTWYDDRKNSERFGAPEGKLPPWGGPARLRVTNRKDWEIGWRHWHFYHVDGTTFVQRFEKGLIIGPFRLTPSNKEAAQVYALTGAGTDNPEWHTSVTLGVSGLHCVEPMDLVPQADATLERPNDKAKASLTTPELQTSDPSRQEKVDGWREMIAEAQGKFKSSGLSLIAVLEQDSRFKSFRRHLSTGALQALTSGTGVRAKDLRSFDDVITMLEEEIIRVEENWGLR